MEMEYKAVLEGGCAEIEEKKSKFIATVYPIATEQEASEYIASVKKTYWDATHNCFAYVAGKNNELQRFSDDGEPGGTAGRPILDLLLLERVCNTLIVVTRYFGGTLLGTGGLVRAYTRSAKEGLSSSLIITKIPGVKLQIETDYTGLGKIQYILGQRGLAILNSGYGESVKLEALVPEEALPEVIAEVTEGTSGQAQFTRQERCWFAKVEGEWRVLE